MRAERFFTRPGCLAALLLAGMLLLAGCGGEFWGGVGDWEPGELGASSVQPARFPAKDS